MLPIRARLTEFFDKQPISWLWTETVLLAFVIGAIDYVTGYEISMVLFYSIPILLITWYTDRLSGVTMAVLCTIIWWWADEASGHPYTSWWLQLWDAAVCLGCFLFFVTVGTAARARILLLERSRKLEQEIIRISEREQRRIGQDLHDGLCQYYAAVGCAAGSLKHNLEKAGAPTAKSAAEIEELIMKGVGQARSLARGLAPVESDERGLQFALETLAASTSQLVGIDCRLHCDSPVAIFDNTSANNLYRIAQESINNARRHGHATVIHLRLETEGDRVSLEIEDNGTGLPQPVPENGGMGLSIMQYRARMIGGQWSIAPRPEGGTIVACSFSQVLPHTAADTDESH
ncbi:MAG TPA: sensor histidine kinase [Chthoniobacter sp.]|jgi:signal transduction histidine kinase